MSYSNLRKFSLQLFIGFLALTALLAIISVLFGEFGKIQRNILATTFTISVVSICSMACAAFIEKHKLRELGFSGIILAGISAFLIILGIWAGISNELYFKSTVTFIVLTIALSHAFLLVLPQLKENHQWVQKASSVTIFILAGMIVVALWGEIANSIYFRILAVVAIVLGLETLVIPILMKLRGRKAQGEKQLVLRNLEKDIYEGPSGKHYKVTELPADHASAE